MLTGTGIRTRAFPNGHRETEDSGGGGEPLSVSWDRERGRRRESPCSDDDDDDDDGEKRRRDLTPSKSCMSSSRIPAREEVIVAVAVAAFPRSTRHVRVFYGQSLSLSLSPDSEILWEKGVVAIGHLSTDRLPLLRAEIVR